jgi:hypothetical protein
MNEPDPASSEVHLPIVPGNSTFLVQGDRGLDLELSTAKGCLWSGRVTAVGIQLVDGSIDFSSPSITYLHLGRHSIIRWRSEKATMAFEVTTAVASLGVGKLTVLAEGVTPALGNEDPVS